MTTIWKKPDFTSSDLGITKIYLFCDYYAMTPDEILVHFKVSHDI
jgi:hypothetical protein